MNLHPSLAGQPPAVAEMLFLQKVKWLDLYGVDKHKGEFRGEVDDEWMMIRGGVKRS
jgi:hypothetical protein